MTRRVQLIRLVGSCLILLIGVVFCQLYSASQMNFLVHSAGLTGAELPAPCLFFSRYSMWLAVLPMVLFAGGVYRLLHKQTSPSSTAEVLSQLALVLAFVLVVTCILAWRLPTYFPVADII